jgi:putative nucleotidyltransferase with HDIG domain
MNKVVISKLNKKKIGFVITIVVLFATLLWMIAKPYFGVRYNYSIGDISNEDIVSPKDITYINKKETEKRIYDVRKRVPVIFDFKTSINEQIIKTLDIFLQYIDTLYSADSSIEEKIKLVNEQVSEDQKVPSEDDGSLMWIFGNQPVDTKTLTDEAVLRDIFTNYEQYNYRSILESTTTYLLNRGLSNFRRDELLQYSENGILLKKIKETEITQEIVSIERVVAEDEIQTAAAAYITENYPKLNATNIDTMVRNVQLLLRSNLFYNSEESIQLLNEEVGKVPPVLNTIKKGAIIIRRGEEINDENSPKLNAISLYTSNFNLKAIVGLGILLALLLYFTLLPFMNEKLWREPKDYLVIAAFILVTVSYAYLVTLIKTTPHYLIFGVFVPIAGTTMTAEVLYKRRFSIILAFILPVLLLLISGNDPFTFLFAIGTGLIGIYSVRNAEKRSDVLKSGPFIVIANVMILTAIGLLREFPSRELFMLLLWGSVNGVISVVLSLGIIPFFEIILNIPTNFRLLELADLNTPIMKKIQVEAQGTYHHSINVANMAENAARYIKANPLLVRVAALYHDIGKIPNAQYFIENNPGVNKHDFIKPTLSNSILKAHVKMGVEMAKKLKLPGEVIDIIEQHHGTSLMKYFYHQAVKNKEDGSEVDKKDYHYQGPKPQTREAAIVMLADSVEAASRTLKNPSAKRIEEFVNEIVESKFTEGQLNESALTLRGLMKISIAFRRYLTGVYHSRIEYPEEKEVKKSKEVSI